MLPAPVDRRFEFVSPGWIDSARSFLTTFLESHSGPAPRDVFDVRSVRRRAAELAGENGRVAWYWRLRDGALDVGAGEISDADLNIRGDYQHVLSMAQGVNAAGEEAQRRARREFRHRAGRDALRITGPMPKEPALLQMINDLHDHMASVTIENPDYAHRVERLGLARQLVELHERGYTVIERAVSGVVRRRTARTRGGRGTQTSSVHH